ncbi:MAG: tetratricopeptide repeat protein [Mariprofundaceae bacterium]|nr:tetratricopeptide repeat protein [Mariprofundaceae bacterium]
MNDTTKRSKNEPVTPGHGEDSAFAAEMEELKRDMHTAQIIDWVQSNRQKLIAGAVAVLIALAGTSLWIEQGKSKKNSAATLYHQALAAASDDDKRAMLELVIRDYGDTGYGSLAHLHMARLGDRETHLKALIHGSGSTVELAWQARLDLAEWYLSNARVDEAGKLLADPVGKQYEQLRHYLMAEAAGDAAEKMKHLKKALAATSNDAFLKARIEVMIAELDAAS